LDNSKLHESRDTRAGDGRTADEFLATCGMILVGPE